MNTRPLLLTLFATLLTSQSGLAAGEIGYIEKFALAEPRDSTLTLLVPGTEDYYYFHCLHYEQTGDRQKFDATLKQWVDRLGETTRVKEIRNRQALLNYPQNPKPTLDYLRRELGLHFDHQREVPGAKPNLPTTLNPRLISDEAFQKKALNSSSTLSGVTDEGLENIVRNHVPLDTARRRDLLQRIKRPDIAGLLPIVAADLASQESSGFGEFPIHSQLLLAQLDELAQAKPDQLNNEHFITAYLRKLQSHADVDWERNPKEREAYLDRLWRFVSRLSPSQNSLKAHVLFSRLEHDRKLGIYDRTRFLDYVKIPKPGPWIRQEYLEKDNNDSRQADLSESFETRLPSIGNDELLVRDYLLHFFAAEDSYTAFAPYLQEERLKALLAEAKILAGSGDIEKWTSLLSPGEFQALKDRVDIEFAQTNPAKFAPSDPVKLDVSLKNVGKLLVKIYEINTLQFYLRTPVEIGTDLDLDGLVANEEQTHAVDEPPLHRVSRTFEFPSLAGRSGVWVVEFIGNGHSSRALIRKGQLQFVSRQSVAGTAFTVLDEENKPAPDASLWLAGHKYTSGKDGEIVVPFSTKPGEQPLILESAGFANLETFELPAENYKFSAGFQVSQEQLLPGKKATVAIRPTLQINGTPAPLKVLEEVRLTVVATDRDGIATTQVIDPFPLPPQGAALHEFLVPDRLAKLDFTLSAKFENLSQGKKMDVADTSSLVVNGIDATEHTDTPLLLRESGQFILEIRGKNGEPKADRAVRLKMRRSEFSQLMEITLKSDENGRVALGNLDGIKWLQAAPTPGPERSWDLVSEYHSYPEALHAKSGEPILLPLTTEKQTVADFSLLSLRDGLFATDLSASLKLTGGFLSIGPLEPGDYSLSLRHENRTIPIRVADGEKRSGKILSGHRFLDQLDPAFLQILSASQEGGEIVIRLANADAGTRVHLLTSRYVPEEFWSFKLNPPPSVDPGYYERGNLDTLYLSGRSIGDEYRYILERKSAVKFPGLMLPRPGLLLNPWALRDTETGQEIAQAGDLYQSLDQAHAMGSGRGEGKFSAFFGTVGHEAPGFFANLDFLGDSAPALYNLQPDAQGVVRVPVAKLAGLQELRIVATDPRSLIQRTLVRDPSKYLFADVRLSKALDLKENFTQRRTITPLDKGQKVTLSDSSSAQAETYDSVAGVYRLFRTLSNDASLAEFSFLPDWPKLSDPQKHEKYSRLACHELNFWLSLKDPTFFDKVVKPHLANKRDRTFMDHYLLGEDLTKYLQPWAFDQLNLVEQILLGRRITKEQPSIARRVADLLESQPPDNDRTSFLFDSALRGNALVQNGVSLVIASEATSASANGPADNEPQPRSGNRLGVAAIASREILAKAAADKPAPPPAPAEAAVAEEMSKDKKQDFDKRAGRDADDLVSRSQVRAFFRKLDPTKEWAENNYYKLPLTEQGPGLIAVNTFWKDFAAWDGKGPFLSIHFPECTRRFSEMMFAMAVLDLPFEPAKHHTEAKAGGLIFEAASPAILFHTEIEPATPESGPATLLASESFFRRDDRFRTENGEQIDKLVTDEFLTGVVYGAQVVATNPTSSPRKIDLLAQIPQGAIPVAGSRATINRALRLQPFATERFEYFFYFPAPGDFTHYPAHLAKDGHGIASANAQAFRVVEHASKVDTASWEYLSQNGTPEQVLTWLETANLQRTAMQRIAWRMRDANFYRKTLDLLQRRHCYIPLLGSYSLLHNDRDGIRDYLQFSNAFVTQCGSWLASDLLTIDPVQRRSYQHLEYNPFINARTYALGGDRRIVNEAILTQYSRLLDIFAHKAALNDEDRLSAAYYLLLQDRVEEGLAMFDRVDVTKIPERLQYDYLRACAGFYRENLGDAREIATRYASHPVDRWKNLFGEVTAQLDEIEGKGRTTGSGKASDTGRDPALEDLASTEPTFDLKVDGGQVRIESRNLPQLTLNFYRMDLEFLFSTNPFVTSEAGRFSIVKPNKTLTVPLVATEAGTTVPLPEEFRNSNVLVEAVGAGITKAQPCYANRLQIQMAANYGRLQVLDSETKKPLPKAYIKVYSRTASGEIRFHKDGYTDLRGKFDYASVSGPEGRDATRFAILILSETNGAAVRETDPPAQ